MNSAIPTELFSLFASTSWRAAWLILVLVLLRRLVRGRIPAQVWFVAWLVVALRLLLPFSIPVAWSPYNYTAGQPVPVAISSPASVVSVSAAAPKAETAIAPVEGVSITPVVAPAVPMPDPIASPKREPGDGLALTWVAGMTLMALLRLAAAGWFRRQLARAVPLDDNRVVAVVADESRRHGRARSMAVFETGAVDAPALYGIVRPRLLFPPRFAQQLDDEELRLVIRHELAHWRRRDLLAQALMQAAVTVHWFNPLAWLAARLARTDCELACDEFVLRRETREGVSAYGATLLKVLGVVRGQRRPGSVVAILEGRQQLAQRVRMIADYRSATVTRVLCGVGLIAAVTATSLTRESQAAAVDRPAVDFPIAPPSQTRLNEIASADQSRNEARTDGSDATAATRQLKAAVEAQQSKVDQLARELQEYKEVNRLAGFDQRHDLINENLKAANMELLRTQQAFNALEVQLHQLEPIRGRRDAMLALPFIASQPMVLSLQQQLANRQIELATLSEKYAERHPSVVRVTTGIEQTERQLDEALRQAARLLESSHAAAAAHYKEAKDRFAQCTQESLDFDRRAMGYHEKERELQVQTQILQTLLARQAEVTRSTATGVTPAAPAVEATPAGGFTVSVVGAVPRQGAIPFAKEDSPIVLDAIARAGGFLARADRNAVRLMRLNADGRRELIGLNESMLMSPSGGATLRRGDVIVVAELPEEIEVKRVAILGQVNNPGNYAFPANGKMTLIDLLARAGGGTRSAQLQKILVKRLEGNDGATRNIVVDVAAFLAGNGSEIFELRPGDIVVVPERVL